VARKDRKRKDLGGGVGARLKRTERKKGLKKVIRNCETVARQENSERRGKKKRKEESFLGGHEIRSKIFQSLKREKATPPKYGEGDRKKN